MKRIKRKGVKRIKLWKLKENNKRQEFEEIFATMTAVGEGDQHQLQESILKATEDVCIKILNQT